MRRRDGFAYSVVDLLVVLLVVFIARSIDASDAPTTKAMQQLQRPLTIKIDWRDPGSTVLCPYDADVDLWIQAPGDVPVGFANSHGKTVDLQHDDLGPSLTYRAECHEDAVARVAVPGEYVVNAMLYSNHGGKLPVPVHLQIWQFGTDAPIVDVMGVLHFVRDEVTLARFSLDDRGDLIPGSINHLFKPLYRPKT